MIKQLSFDELDSYVRQICLGEKLTQVEAGSGEFVQLLFRYPTTRDLMVAEAVQQKAAEKAKKEGLPSVSDIDRVVRERGIFTEKDELEIEKLRSRLKGQKAVLSKTTKVPARRDRLKGIIKDLEKKIEEIVLKRESPRELTWERKAAEEKFLYLTRRGVYIPGTHDLYWGSESSFHGETDFILRKRVFLSYTIFSHGLSQEIIRFIARSNLWRIRYVTAVKTSDSLFGKPISEYNVDQLALLYWSHYYQSVYDMLPDDRPPDSIIEDDMALDAYMRSWSEERNREAAAARAKKGGVVSDSSAWDHGETLVMQSNPMYKDIQYSRTIPELGLDGGDKVHDAAHVGRGKGGSN